MHIARSFDGFKTKNGNQNCLHIGLLTKVQTLLQITFEFGREEAFQEP